MIDADQCTICTQMASVQATTCANSYTTNRVTQSLVEPARIEGACVLQVALPKQLKQLLEEKLCNYDADNGKNSALLPMQM